MWTSEVLIIDDASPDDSFDVAQQLAEQDRRVEVRRHSMNLGHIATYNEGLLGWADGEYSVLISADDMLTQGSLSRSITVLERYREVGMVYGHTVFWMDDQPPPPPRTAVSGVTVWKGQEWLGIMCRLGHNLVTSPEVVVRTSVQRRVGGYRTELPHTGDMEMWLRLAANADIAFIKGVDQAYYRKHATNMTTFRVPLVDLQQRRAAFESFFREYLDRVPNAANLRRTAQRRIAKEALWSACRAYERRRMESTPNSRA